MEIECQYSTETEFSCVADTAQLTDAFYPFLFPLYTIIFLIMVFMLTIIVNMRKA